MDRLEAAAREVVFSLPFPYLFMREGGGSGHGSTTLSSDLFILSLMFLWPVKLAYARSLHYEEDERGALSGVGHIQNHSLFFSLIHLFSLFFGGGVGGGMRLLVGWDFSCASKDRLDGEHHSYRIQPASRENKRVRTRYLKRTPILLSPARVNPCCMMFVFSLSLSQYNVFGQPRKLRNTLPSLMKNQGIFHVHLIIATSLLWK